MSIAQKLTTIAENEQKVYKAGQDSQKPIIKNLESQIDSLNSEMTAISKRYGRYANELVETRNKMQELGIVVEDDEIDGIDYSNVSEGVSGVYESGKKSQYDEFWDNIQENGTRVDYNTAFCSRGWNAKIFKPKYDIRPNSAERMFFQYNYGNSEEDFVETLKQADALLDFSNNTNSAYYAFSYARIKKLGVIDFSKTKTIYGAFMNGYMTEIEKVIFGNETQTQTNVFYNMLNLKRITLEGYLYTTQNVSASKNLEKSSIINFIDALSVNTVNQTLTLSLKAVNREFETSNAMSDGSTSEEWNMLIETKPNWTISLV